MTVRLQVRVSPDFMQASLDAQGAIDPQGELPTWGELAAVLAESGVVFGIREDALHAWLGALADPTKAERRALAAEGLPPQHGQDAALEDALETGALCRQGAVLARLRPATAGTAGTNVRGTAVPARTGVARKPVAGPGTALSEDGSGRLLASVSGALRREGDRFSVLSLVEVDPDGQCARLGAVELGAWPDEGELADILREAGVTQGVDLSAWADLRQRAQAGEAPGDAVLARGRAPQDGGDGRIEWLCRTQLRVGATQADGRMDYRDRGFGETMTTRDTPLARVHAPIAGVPGLSVRGEVLPPREGRPAELLAGEGVRAEEGGALLVADRDGRVVMLHDQLGVYEMVSVEGDVDFRTGHIVAERQGVLIGGSLRSGFDVTCGDPLVIRGTAGDSRLKAQGSVSITGGVHHGERGQVEAGGHFEANYALNARLQVAGDVTVPGGMVNCHAISGGQIVCMGEKGRISGGEASAVAGIEVQEAGSAAAVTTRLILGSLPRRLAELRAAIQALEQRLRPLRSRLGRNVIAQRGAGLEGKALAGYQQYEQLDGERRRLVDQRAELEAQRQAEGAKAGRVRVHGCVHPGVQVEISGSVFKVEQPLAAVEFYYREDESRVDYRPCEEQGPVSK